MATMEGPLSKWTNVVKGWQYRWFVLDENAGLLSYYTSKEKMKRGARRGCVRLKGSVIGIDDEEDSTFTITVDQKTFHFQAHDCDEKEKWIDALEGAVLRHSQPSKKWGNHRSVPTTVDFEHKLAETDAYLQVLIDQVKSLEARISSSESESCRDKCNPIRTAAEAMIESVKQSIVLLQISKHSILEQVEEQNTLPLLHVQNVSSGAASSGLSTDSLTIHVPERIQHDTDGASNELLVNGVADENIDHLSSSSLASQPDPEVASVGRDGQSQHSAGSQSWPEASYSSSDEEDFFDAEEGTGKAGIADAEEPKTPPVVISSPDDNYDELYDVVDESDLGSLDSHGSLITHLLSQVRIGMDLTKVVLPTFILEKRSLLEMYADFLAHPDLFSQIADQTTPRERMVQCVKWYLSAFHAGRRSQVAKKPYNPILGETFRCFFRLPGENSDELADDGPVPWCSKDNVAFVAEQVSHHPPISAFYAENQKKRISADGYIWTKSKFLGLSIGVHMIGQAVISVLEHGEEYIITFPNGYGRSILTVPWIELGGKVNITCAKTGYNATVDFHTKPFYGGKKDQVSAEIYAPNDKKSFCTVKGEWNGIMWAKYAQGMTQNEVFVDTTSMPVIKKQVIPRTQQGEFESRRLWQDVTSNLKANNVEAATAAKHKLEQRQRAEAKERLETGIKWETKHFHEVGEHWVYDNPLVKRIES